MRKSKEQKQLEALARKRELFDEKSVWYRRFQEGGDFYNDNCAKYGLAYAQQRKNEVSASFARYLVEAQLDYHGNPTQPVTKKVDWDGIKKTPNNAAIHSYLAELENE